MPLHYSPEFPLYSRVALQSLRRVKELAKKKLRIKSSRFCICILKPFQTLIFYQSPLYRNFSLYSVYRDYLSLNKLFTKVTIKKLISAQHLVDTLGRIA